MTLDQGPAAITMFIIAFGVTVFAFAKLHLLEPVLKHHYHPRNKEDRKPRDVRYGIYNQKNDLENTK